MLRQHGIQRVAPGAAIIAAGGTHEHGRRADKRALALNRRPENLADANVAHARYSAQVFGVSDTRTHVTSGQRARHQSNSHLAMTSAVVRSCPSTSFRCLWSTVSSRNDFSAESSW